MLCGLRKAAARQPRDEVLRRRAHRLRFAQLPDGKEFEEVFENGFLKSDNPEQPSAEQASAEQPEIKTAPGEK